jgi:hypothetical protein
MFSVIWIKLSMNAFGAWLLVHITILIFERLLCISMPTDSGHRSPLLIASATSFPTRLVCFVNVLRVRLNAVSPLATSLACSMEVDSFSPKRSRYRYKPRILPDADARCNIYMETINQYNS